MKTIGPTVRKFPESSMLVCTRCEYLKNNLVRSGRNPQWESLCLHPKAKAFVAKEHPFTRVWASNFADGCWIGYTDNTPDWCPELKCNLPPTA